MKRPVRLTSDDIGYRGQALFYTLITNYSSPDTPIFRPYALGEKFPTFDYHVELVGARKPGRFFLAQVKTTTLGYTVRKARLRISVSRPDVLRMLAMPVPTYLFGIDEPGKKGFIWSVNEGRGDGISGLPTKFPIDMENLQILWNEVDQFWQVRDMRLLGSRFGPRG